MLTLIIRYMMALSFIGTVSCTPAEVLSKGLRYEEYVIEHDISSTQAKNAVQTIDLNSIVTPPGCHTCSSAEMKYCLGPDLINDHCCCDRRYHEVLPFIPHTCYIGNQLCSTIVADCDHYTRIRICCCDKYVLEKWRAYYMKSSSDVVKSILVPIVVNIFICFYFV